jgi:outer membrane lipase/esterase
MKFRGIRSCGLVLFLLAALGLASCGGGTQVVPFAPNRVLVFGDENNVIDSAGRKYSINGLNATSGALDCTLYPIWVQAMATAYGQVFPECNPTGIATNSRILATVNSKAADLKTQIDSFIAGGGLFTPNDLVLVTTGQNDVLEQYALYPTTPITTLQATLNARGQAFAVQINRLATLNARVVVGKLFDLSFTPFAFTEAANNPVPSGTDSRQVVIKSLTLAFNTGFFAALTNDANHIGEFDPDQNFANVIVNPGNGGLSNSSVAACLATAPLPNCSTSTLIAGATVVSYLWADATHPGYEGHLLISALAYQRAAGNPF